MGHWAPVSARASPALEDWSPVSVQDGGREGMILRGMWSVRGSCVGTVRERRRQVACAGHDAGASLDDGQQSCTAPEPAEELSEPGSLDGALLCCRWVYTGVNLGSLDTRPDGACGTWWYLAALPYVVVGLFTVAWHLDDTVLYLLTWVSRTRGHHKLA